MVAACVFGKYMQVQAPDVAAVLQCTRAADRAVAKYELTHAVRSHIGSDDDAFNAIRQREDEVRAPPTHHLLLGRRASQHITLCISSSCCCVLGW